MTRLGAVLTRFWSSLRLRRAPGRWLEKRSMRNGDLCADRQTRAPRPRIQARSLEPSEAEAFNALLGRTFSASTCNRDSWPGCSLLGVTASSSPQRGHRIDCLFPDSANPPEQRLGEALPAQSQRPYQTPVCWAYRYFLRRARPSSVSWMESTLEGAPAIGSAPLWVFGKAMTSRNDALPVMSMTIRSRPSPMPPWGGAP